MNFWLNATGGRHDSFTGWIGGGLSEAGSCLLDAGCAYTVGGPIGGAANAILGRGAAATTAVAATEFRLTRTVAGQVASRPYINLSSNTWNIINNGVRAPDPQGVQGAYQYILHGQTFRGSQGFYELIYRPSDGMIFHYVFKSYR